MGSNHIKLKSDGFSNPFFCTHQGSVDNPPPSQDRHQHKCFKDGIQYYILGWSNCAYSLFRLFQFSAFLGLKWRNFNILALRLFKRKEGCPLYPPYSRCGIELFLFEGFTYIAEAVTNFRVSYANATKKRATLLSTRDQNERMGNAIRSRTSRLMLFSVLGSDYPQFMERG